MKMPSVFIAHGSPMLAVENDDVSAALARFGKNVSKPKAVVVMSAHWESAQEILVNTVAKPGMIYDFGGFPDELYEIVYAAAGEPGLAKEISDLLNAGGLGAELETRRGLDHGAWVPLLRIFPKAEIPVVEISLPQPRTPEKIFKMGKTLAPLRERGVLLMGTGGIVHNLRRARLGDKDGAVDAWAKEFDDWVAERVTRSEIAKLMNYRREAPHADLCVPTSEHFDPIYFVLGAGTGESIDMIHEGFQYGNLSMRSFSVGAHG